MRFFLFIISIVTIFTSCTDNSRVGKHSEQDFFDLKSYVEKEVLNFSTGTCSIYKEGEINGESDQQSISAADFKWDRELKILADVDIRKSSWYDYFSIDTIVKDSLSIVRYQTSSTKIPVKRLEITYPEGNFEQPLFIEAERVSENWIFHSEQIIHYTTGAALQAEGWQKILWFQQKNFRITTVYNCKDESN